MSWLEPTQTDHDYLQLLQKEAPQHCELLKVLALALRIEPLLLRNARLQFAPGSDIELETNIWFSNIMQSRNAKACVIHDGIAALLVDELSKEQSAYDRAWAFVQQHTRHWSAQDRLEQQLRFASRTPDANQVLHDGFNKILSTLVNTSDPISKRDLSRWVKASLPALIKANDQSEAAHLLFQYTAATLGLPATWSANKQSAKASMPQWLIEALPSQTENSLGIQLHPNALECVSADGADHRLKVKLPLPTPVLLSSDRDLSPRWESLWLGKKIALAKGYKSLSLQTLDGQLYRFKIRNPTEDVTTNSAADRGINLMYLPEDQELATQIKDQLKQQGLDVNLVAELNPAEATVATNRAVIRIWSNSSAHYWSSKSLQTEEHQRSQGLLLRSDPEVPLPEGFADQALDVMDWQNEKSAEQLASLIRQKLDFPSPSQSAPIADESDDKNGSEPSRSTKKTCFVIQGFGKKTDYTDGRVLDLDASYEVIKEAVELAGLECVRADEITHSGAIERLEYEWLLNADLVIADLSANNFGAVYQLGVRYALRPFVTIVLAEEHFRNPFDLSHIVIRRYKHLGDEIDFHEANRLKEELKSTIETVISNPHTDSPVYTFIPELMPPELAMLSSGKGKLMFTQNSKRSGKAQAFVIQGFGKKTDYTNGRVLDLDESYGMIKTAAESAGLECVRADEIIHDGTINVPSYEQLLHADIVIADLSTYNLNAAFELGVRFALRPYSTIVLAEDQFKNPFFLSHIVIRRYKHLGDGIGFREANRLMNELKSAIEVILNKPITDSPVYTFLPQLQPPELAQPAAKAFTAAASATPDAGAPSPAADIIGEDNPSAKVLIDAAMDKIAVSDFPSARVLLEEVKKLRPKDSFVLQQLALATYKSKQPTVMASLEAAREILKELSPETSNNPETLGLWGTILKRLWEESSQTECLSESISAYEHGFFLKQDHYNGINLAYMLNVRALESLKGGNLDDAISDYAQAQRVRKEVIRYASPLADSLEDTNNRYWVIATLYEAAIGTGDNQAIAEWAAKAKAMNVPAWMQETRESQAEKLKQLLDQYAQLMNQGA